MLRMNMQDVSRRDQGCSTRAIAAPDHRGAHSCAGAAGGKTRECGPGSAEERSDQHLGDADLVVDTLDSEDTRLDHNEELSKGLETSERVFWVLDPLVHSKNLKEVKSTPREFEQQRDVKLFLGVSAPLNDAVLSRRAELWCHRCCPCV